jgi:ribosomal protein S18 acetylase RimI-like enzyme
MSDEARIVIRPLDGREEAEACARVMSQSEPWITLQRTYDHAIKGLTDPTREIYVALLEEALCGFVMINMVGPFRGYIQTICVFPDCRDQGIGRKLIQFAEERVFRDSPNVFLCVSSFNTDAQRFYEQLGYKRIGEIDDYVVEGHSEFLMRKTVGPLAGYDFRRN